MIGTSNNITVSSRILSKELSKTTIYGLKQQGVAPLPTTRRAMTLHIGAGEDGL
jgi:hypothetical protein